MNERSGPGTELQTRPLTQTSQLTSNIFATRYFFPSSPFFFTVSLLLGSEARSRLIKLEVNMKMKIIIKDRIGMQAKYTPNLLVDSEKKKKQWSAKGAPHAFLIFSSPLHVCRVGSMVCPWYSKKEKMPCHPSMQVCRISLSCFQ